MKEKNGTPSWAVSLIPFAVLVAMLVPIVAIFGSDALSGASEVALLAAAACAIGISMLVYGTPWSVIESAISNSFKSIAPALLILLMIGALSGAWMVSGIVPTLISYGMRILSPKVFLFTCCIISAAVSLLTGSSWTTIATIGVALVGIGQAMGFSSGWTAGAIISGAYFGDKISPLSDTTVLASSSAGTELFRHIRYMLITTVPSISISLVIFLVASLTLSPANGAMEESFSAALDGTFKLSPWLLIVPVFTGFLIAKKVPSVITLFCGAIAALIAALIAQPDIIAGIGGSDTLDAASAFKGSLICLYGSTAIETGNEALNSLVATRGMTGMFNTVFLIISAVTFGGAMTGSGMVQSITNAIISLLHRRTSTVAATVVGGVAANIISGDQYLSILLTTSLFKKLYEEKGYENRLLSRSVEDSATVTSVLIPWNSCGMTQSTVLMVPTMSYLPYCFFNLISPLMSILIAATGYRITSTKVLTSDSSKGRSTRM